MANGITSYQELLENCAQKQSSALKQLYDLEAPHFLALGQSLLHRSADAEELVRESFVLIWRNANAYAASMGSARAWIYSIFRFRAQQKRQKNVSLSPLAKPKSQYYIPASASHELLQFQHLGDITKHMIALAYLHGFNYAEIAKTCHCSIQQSQSSIQEGLLRLTHLFTGWQNDSDQHLILLGEYCLGVLSTPESASPAHQLLQTDPSAAQDLLLWEEVFSHLALCLPALTPPSYLLSRIYQDLGLPLSEALPHHNPKPTPQAQPLTESTPSTPSESLLKVISASGTIEPTSSQAQTKPASVTQPTTPEPTAPTKPVAATKAPTPKTSTSIEKPANTPEPSTTATQIVSNKRWGRWAAGIITAGLCAFAIWAFMPKAPIVHLVQMSPQAGAVLQAPGQSSTPGWILSVDTEGHVILTPQVQTEITPNQAVQLWTQRPNESAMRSLGLIHPNQPVTIPAETIGPIEKGQIFEMTLESNNGSPSPNGPILFIGRVVTFGEHPTSPEQSEV